MSLDSDALRAAIIHDRHDDAPRLVYCDWLEENRFDQLAEFIRYQVYNPKDLNRWVCEVEANRLERFEGRYIHKGCWWLSDKVDQEWFKPYASEIIAKRTDWTWYWRRGFVDQISHMTSTQWLDNCDQLTSSYPLTKVVLSSRLGWSGNGGPGNRPSLYGAETIIDTGPWNRRGNKRYECRRAITPYVEGTSDWEEAMRWVIKQEWPDIEIEMPASEEATIDTGNVWGAQDVGRRMAERIERETLRQLAPVRELILDDRTLNSFLVSERLRRQGL